MPGYRPQPPVQDLLAELLDLLEDEGRRHLVPLVLGMARVTVPEAVTQLFRAVDETHAPWSADRWTSAWRVAGELDALLCCSDLEDPAQIRRLARSLTRLELEAMRNAARTRLERGQEPAELLDAAAKKLDQALRRATRGGRSPAPTDGLSRSTSAVAAIDRGFAGVGRQDRQVRQLQA